MSLREVMGVILLLIGKIKYKYSKPAADMSEFHSGNMRLSYVKDTFLTDGAFSIDNVLYQWYWLVFFCLKFA